MVAQALFYNLYFFLYLLAPKTAHRVVGYLEEEAVISYTHYLEEIDSSRVENVSAPQIALNYWNLQSTARLRDVVVAVCADEAHHRDTNHHFANQIQPHKTWAIFRFLNQRRIVHIRGGQNSGHRSMNANLPHQSSGINSLQTNHVISLQIAIQ